MLASVQGFALILLTMRFCKTGHLVEIQAICIGQYYLVALNISLEFLDSAVSTNPELRMQYKHEQKERLSLITSFATVVMNFSSCEMMITPPFHVLSAVMSASKP